MNEIVPRRVAIVGGSGVFGSRLAELLVRDGHHVTVMGRRRAPLEAVATKHGVHYAVVDLRASPLSIFDHAPDAVVDAAGPFQTYGADYALPRLCIERGVHYIDLSDDARFTQGIEALDPMAKAAGCSAVSGASSVPGLSSVVITQLAEGLERLELIESAIVPGNRAPRGVSVIAAILGQLGQVSQVWRGGAQRDAIGWTDRRRVVLAKGLRRWAYFIEVPDIKLFPQHFAARSVMFRAGMELGLLNHSLALIAAIRRRIAFSFPPWLLRLVRFLAALTYPLGSDRGGMRVAVIGYDGDRAVRREWRLIAEAGDGPYIPAVTARSILRRLEQTAPGARPCLAEVTLTEITAAMADLKVTTEIDETPAVTVFQRCLGPDWDRLAKPLRRLARVYDLEVFDGVAQVERGNSLPVRVLSWFIGFPQAGADIPLKVTKTRIDDFERWERDFDGQRFHSRMGPAQDQGRCVEAFGLFRFELDLSVGDGGALEYSMGRGWFWLIPLPRWLLPTCAAREWDEGGVFQFVVALTAPLRAGLIVRYRGHLQPSDEASDIPAR
ncbi:MAG: DUF4166 domain-containing protein [Pseudomonadota bacterium]